VTLPQPIRRLTNMVNSGRDGTGRMSREITALGMNRKRSRVRRFGMLLALTPVLIFSGCRSAVGLFLPVDFHPEVVSQARSAVLAEDHGRLDSVLKDLNQQTGKASRILFLLESGRLHSLAGNESASMAAYAEAEELFEDEWLRAQFRLSDTLAQGVSMVTNDRALPYRGQLHERMLLQTYQAFHHLREGDLTKARIALNVALRDLRWGADNLEQLSRQGDAAIREQGIRAAGNPSLLNPAHEAANPRRSTDNALVFYLSGLLHEVAGERERAAIDYRNALAFAPFEEPIHDALRSLDGIPEGQGRVVILHETDWVSPKIPFSFSIFLKDRSYTLSLPYYPETPYYNRFPEAFVEVGDYQPRLYPILNVDAVVRRAHEEIFPGIMLRQVLRMVAKQEVQAEAEEADPLLGLAASLYSILSDSPDLRSWQSLPAAIYVGDMTLPVGAHALRTGLGKDSLINIEVTPEAITLIRLATANGKRIKVDSYRLPVNQ